MLNVNFGLEEGCPLKILCLGAHSDDIEIGCGGTILKLVEKYENGVFYWVVFSSDKRRKREAEKSARAFLRRSESDGIMINDFKDGFFPYIGREIKEYFEVLKRKIDPDLIFTHYRSDLHQDHRLISDLTWNTFRDHWILEYEIPKYDGDLGRPNLYVQLEKEIVDRKIGYLLKFFQSQRENAWFKRETFQALHRLRGIESNSPHQYAEAFYSRKMVVL
jgi:LmbE family N-acetylglucosaminyl deacetylase